MLGASLLIAAAVPAVTIAIIPIVGWILLIVWWATDSQPDNEYGTNPKGGAATV